MMHSMFATKLDEFITIGAQPSSRQIRELSRRGYRAIVNLRLEGEGGTAIAEEAQCAEEAGLEYWHVPVTPDEFTRACLDRFRKAVEFVQGPIYVHCCEGTRARAIAFLHHALESEKPWNELWEEAVRLGIAPDGEKTRKRLQQFLEEHWTHEVERMRNFRWVCH